MKYLLAILISLASTNHARAQIVNQSALTVAGGHQGQIGGHYFEYSLGDAFTVTGQSPAIVNTTGIIQPALSEVALPVTLVSFTAAKSGESQVNLQWVTSAETGSSRFEIQRSTDGKNWEHIGTVKASGETAGIGASYDFSDLEPRDGSNIYRLKMIDLDETFTFSNSASIYIRNPLAIRIYPNPASDFVNVENVTGEGITQILIHHAGGRAIYHSTSEPTQPINVKKLLPGIYVVSIITQNGQSKKHRLVISR